MTNAIHTVRTVTEHRFIVPCEGPWGGDIGTFTDAMAWARKAAAEAGINTSSDDWLRLRCEDDQLVLTLTIEGRERDGDAPTCTCKRCAPGYSGMRVCANCGSKRCSRAENHAEMCDEVRDS